jgi:hypothetical protein
MSNKEYFETCSKILNNDTKRFIQRISFEAYCNYDIPYSEYCELLERMIKNHVEIEEYEIAEGLKLCLNKIKDEVLEHFDTNWI